MTAKKKAFQILMVSATLCMSASTAFAGLDPSTPLPPPDIDTGFDQCRTVPRTLNASRGDIILTTATGGPIKALINSIGQKYTHTGIAVSSTHVRHNTMDVGGVDTEANVGFGVVPSELNATDLRDGKPGMGTEYASYGMAYDSFESGLVITGPSEYATQRRNAAAQMEGMNGYYRLYAYTNMTWANPTTRTANDGNMCSGSVAYANFRAGNLPSSTRVDYTLEVRNQAAQVLYDETRKRIRSKIEASDGSWLIRDARKDEIASDMANQVVNCMAFNDCGNQSFRWRNGVGTGKTISPDDLGTITSLYALISYLANKPNPFPYQSTKPVEVTSSGYCCRVTATNTMKCW